MTQRKKQRLLRKNQKTKEKFLSENQITNCSGPAGVGKSYIVIK